MRFSIKDKHIDETCAILSKEYYHWQRLDHQLASSKNLFIRVVDFTIELEDFDTNIKMEAMLQVAEYIKQNIMESFTNLSKSVSVDCRRTSPVTFTLRVLPILKENLNFCHYSYYLPVILEDSKALCTFCFSSQYIGPALVACNDSVLCTYNHYCH